MNAEYWQQVQAVFSAAVEASPTQRAALLRERCGGNAALRADVESLLATHDADPDFLEEPVGHVHAVLTDPPAIASGAAPDEDRVGPYRVLGRLGAGGMGTIYLAERDGDPLGRRVALKLVKRGMDTDEILRRFHSERKILAALDHPGIARIFDGGRAADGRPYFVMEYVADAVPITTYCDREQLRVPERLRLFRDVCTAVHYAHQNLVVHRDLKPSNILVSAAGQVKLLDFGIAKLLDADRIGITAPTTRTALRLMTPEYASPEQVHGGAITTASDVYALGVLLYELLTGHRPHDLSRATPADIARVLAEDTPEKPSSRVRSQADTMPGAAERARTLGGDLDTIVLKALHKDPQRRYASAEALADDLERFLNGLPVAARPDTIGYRARKFVRRHRLAVGSAAAVFVLVLGFGIVMAVQAARIARQATELAAERDRARYEATKAAQVSTFLTDLFQAADPVTMRGGALTVRELLGQGAASLERDLADHPEVQLELLDVLIDTYTNMGLYEEVLAAARASHELRRATFGLEHAETARGLYRLGEAHLLNGRFADAEAHLREALDLQRRVLPTPDTATARTLTRLTRTLRINDRYDQAEAFGREAVALYRSLGMAEHPEMADALYWLAQAVREHDPGAGEALFEDVVALRRRVLGAEHPEVGWALSSLGDLKMRRGAFDEAEAHIREALALQRRVYGNEHPDVSRILMSLARLHIQRGDVPAAAAVFREAAAIREATLGPDHPSTRAAHRQIDALLQQPTRQQ